MKGDKVIKLRMHFLDNFIKRGGELVDTFGDRFMKDVNDAYHKELKRRGIEK